MKVRLLGPSKQEHGPQFWLLLTPEGIDDQTVCDQTRNACAPYVIPSFIDADAQRALDMGSKIVPLCA